MLLIHVASTNWKHVLEENYSTDLSTPNSRIKQLQGYPKSIPQAMHLKMK